MKTLHYHRLLVNFGFRLGLGRTPTSRELDLLRDAWHEFQWNYEHNRRNAEQLLAVGEFPRANNFDSVQLAAMTMLASTIMNLDAAVTKE